MAGNSITLAKQVVEGRSNAVTLDAEQEKRFQGLVEDVTMIDLHQHPMVKPEDPSRYMEYLRSGDYEWGYEAIRHGGFTAVGTANVYRGMLNAEDMSFIRFEDLLDEIGLMLSDVGRNDEVVKVSNSDEIEAAKQQGKIGILPTVEHLAIGNELQHVDVLYNAGIRLAGMTYRRKSYIGDGHLERNDGGLSLFGIEVIQRMNELGMVVDLSHASFRTAMDAIEFSEAPVAFSHDGSYTLGLKQGGGEYAAGRLRRDEELLACAKKGGIIGVTVQPSVISSWGSELSLDLLLDHYDYMVKLLGIDHVAIGTDSSIDVRTSGFVRGVDSPAEGKNIIRGLITRGYSDDDILKITGGNALTFFRRVMS
ncbi:MAG: membrane dipeptidase [Dehalococcoidia bacterium]|nr:membrane dipeptidase [Dehalococcoidia bacterium]